MYDQNAIEAARLVATQAQDDFFDIRGNGAVVLSAVAGAGKSHFVVDTVKQCGERHARVAVAAPTNDQVFSLVRSIAENEPNRTVTFIPASTVTPPSWLRHPNIQITSPAYAASRADIVVGTIDKFGSALNPARASIQTLGSFDALIMDESYQADAGQYFALGAIAPKHLCVGDGGQIHPFSTLEAGRQWRGLPEDPLQTAIDVLLNNHPQTVLHRFPITRRLDPRAARIARCFYPIEHIFGAAVLDGVRTMTLGAAIAPTARDKAMDGALSLAAKEGWAHLELPARQTLVADPDTAHIIVDLVRRLRNRNPQLTCERQQRPTAMAMNRVAIGVSHNQQKSMVRILLDQANLGDVVVDTANKLQGLEFDVVVVWHPLAGLTTTDEFHLEAGRICVLCTRHRHACIVVGRQADRELVEALPPAAPSYPGAQSEDLLHGWEVHRRIFEELQNLRIAIR